MMNKQPKLKEIILWTNELELICIYTYMTESFCCVLWVWCYILLLQINFHLIWTSLIFFFDYLSFLVSLLFVYLCPFLPSLFVDYIILGNPHLKFIEIFLGLCCFILKPKGKKKIHSWYDTNTVTRKLKLISSNERYRTAS